MAERKKILLRLDPAVHDALARWAGDELRSTNAQIEFLLRRALADAGRMPGSARRMRGRGRPRKGTAPDTDEHETDERETDERDPPGPAPVGPGGGSEDE
ncbi:MAG: hypothetical protein ACRDNL_19815 [Spirillospora sp.]